MDNYTVPEIEALQRNDPCEGCINKDGHRCNVTYTYRFDKRSIPKLPCPKYTKRDDLPCATCGHPRSEHGVFGALAYTDADCYHENDGSVCACTGFTAKKDDPPCATCGHPKSEHAHVSNDEMVYWECTHYGRVGDAESPEEYEHCECKQFTAKGE